LHIEKSRREWERERGLKYDIMKRGVVCVERKYALPKIKHGPVPVFNKALFRARLGISALGGGA
jgi:hypothetical protein